MIDITYQTWFFSITKKLYSKSTKNWIKISSRVVDFLNSFETFPMICTITFADNSFWSSQSVKVICKLLFLSFSNFYHRFIFFHFNFEMIKLRSNWGQILPYFFLALCNQNESIWSGFMQLRINISVKLTTNYRVNYC